MFLSYIFSRLKISICFLNIKKLKYFSYLNEEYKYQY